MIVIGTAIVVPVVCACIAFLIVLTSVILPSSRYHAALELYKAGKYEEAAKAFNKLNYKKSEEKAQDAFFLLQEPALADIAVGQTIKFGIYEQDNNLRNGKEEIEWKVLAVEGDKALIISKYALDCRQYHSTSGDVTWEECDLRAWLNDTFLSQAFGTKHQERILSSYVPIREDSFSQEDSGNATTDKVFLLDSYEAGLYFEDKIARECKPTAYAIANGVSEFGSTKTEDDAGSSCWWLRQSPGTIYAATACVEYDGFVSSSKSAISRYVGVRPALWITLES